MLIDMYDIDCIYRVMRDGVVIETEERDGLMVSKKINGVPQRVTDPPQSVDSETTKKETLVK